MSVCKERRIMLLGDPGCGKTSLLRSANCEVSTEGEGLPTVYYKFLPRTSPVTEGAGERVDETGKKKKKRNKKKKKKKELLISLWDSPSLGGEAAREAVFPKLDAVLMVFALDDPCTLESVRRVWYPQVRGHCSRKIPVVLVGNKADLRDENGVSYQQGLKVAEKIKAYAYVECSALGDEDSLNAFKFAIRAVVKSSKCSIM